MRQRRLSSKPDGSANFPASELSLLAREVRRRQHLTRSTQPARRLQPLSLPEAISTQQVAVSTFPPAEDLDEVQPARPEASFPQHHAPSLQMLGHHRPAAKERNKARYGGRDTRRRERTVQNQKNNSRNHHHPSSAASYQKRLDDGQELDPGVEAAMLRVFSGDGGSRGVSVSAIRRLYRKRHEEEKARAMEEVRRWWRVGRSEAVPLAEASVAASLLLASRDGDNHNSFDGEPAVVLTENSVVLQNEDHPKLTNDAVVTDSVSTSTADGSARRPASRREPRDREQAHSVFDDLDCRQVLQDPSYAASVVRDVKQALRAGQAVQIRSRQGPSIGRRSSADIQLMLRTLYMQCVRVSVEEGGI